MKKVLMATCLLSSVLAIQAIQKWKVDLTTKKGVVYVESKTMDREEMLAAGKTMTVDMSSRPLAHVDLRLSPDGRVLGAIGPDETNTKLQAWWKHLKDGTTPTSDLKDTPTTILDLEDGTTATLDLDNNNSVKFTFHKLGTTRTRSKPKVESAFI